MLIESGFAAGIKKEAKAIHQKIKEKKKDRKNNASIPKRGIVEVIPSDMEWQHPADKYNDLRTNKGLVHSHLLYF